MVLVGRGGSKEGGQTTKMPRLKSPQRMSLLRGVSHFRGRGMRGGKGNDA